MEKKRKGILKFRINLMFFGIFILFIILIMRLGVIQVIHGEEYSEKVMEKQDKVVELSTPRGRILDRNGNTMVGNDPINAITYTRPVGVTTYNHLKLAKNLAPFINKETEDITQRDMKDYWILTRPKEAKDKLTKEELTTRKDMQLYQLQLDRITDEDLSEISGTELEIIAIKRELDQAATLTEHIIDRKNVSNKEVAKVNANLLNLPGIGSKVDWNRKYVSEGVMRSLYGNITSPSEGLPSEELPYYLSRGYKRNDRVGVSFLEKEYEDILQGKEKQVLFKYKEGQQVTFSHIKREGRRGYDLVLTIDATLQKKVESILKEELEKAKKKFPKGNKYLDKAFAILMNPQTGEILSMAGKNIIGKRDGEFIYSDLAIGNILFAYPMGSTVKAATVLTGYKTGAIEPGTVFLDSPIKIKNTPIKKSYKNLGLVNDLEALKLSSNVYMWKLAMKLGEYDYQYNQAAEFKNPQALDQMRYYFKQFGLGASTQIDLPYEGTGYKGSGGKIGFLMDFAIGQYDTYTPLQLAQYISTIANNGYRLKPHLLREVRSSVNGGTIFSAKPQIINRVEMDLDLIKRVQKGLHKVMKEPGGTGYPYFHDTPYEVAGKTGTAEVFHSSGKKLYNLTLVGYAPYKNPTVAFAVVVPYVSDNYSINKYIGRKILDAYFEMKQLGKEKIVTES